MSKLRIMWFKRFQWKGTFSWKSSIHKGWKGSSTFSWKSIHKVEKVLVNKPAAVQWHPHNLECFRETTWDYQIIIGVMKPKSAENDLALRFCLDFVTHIYGMGVGCLKSSRRIVWNNLAPAATVLHIILHVILSVIGWTGHLIITLETDHHSERCPSNTISWARFMKIFDF